MPDASSESPPTISYRGVPIRAERPKGFVQRGTGTDGRPWARVYGYDRRTGAPLPGFVTYGDVAGTTSADGEKLDAYLGDDLDADVVYVIEQGGGDPELKLVFGVPDIATAELFYTAHVPEEMLVSIRQVPLELVQALLGVDAAGHVEKAEKAVTRADLEALLARLNEQPAPIGDAPPTTEPVALEARFVQKADALRFVLAIVLEPLDHAVGEADTQGDAYTAERIREGMWFWVKHFRNVLLHHSRQGGIVVNDKVHVVENYQAPADMVVAGSNVKRGTWLIGLHFVDDDLWGMVARGELQSVSIEGLAERVPIASA
jgi:hypothetical protein